MSSTQTKPSLSHHGNLVWTRVRKPVKFKNIKYTCDLIACLVSRPQLFGTNNLNIFHWSAKVDFATWGLLPFGAPVASCGWQTVQPFAWGRNYGCVDWILAWKPWLHMLSYPNTIWTLVASTTRSGPSGSQEHFGKFWLTTKLPQMFFLIPVFCKVRHSWCQMVHLLNMSDENCRNHKTLAEEDVLGHITRLASACHGATVVVRFFQRFGLFLALHWDNLIRRQAEIPS
jgi:hypothetical protein